MTSRLIKSHHEEHEAHEGRLFGSLLAAGLVDTVELGVSPLLLGSSGSPMLALDRPLPRSVRLDLTHHAALPSGLLVLEYAVRAAPSEKRVRAVRAKRVVHDPI